MRITPSDSAGDSLLVQPVADQGARSTPQADRIEAHPNQKIAHPLLDGDSMEDIPGLIVPLKKIQPVIAFDVEFVRGPRIFVTKKPKFINIPIRVAVVDMYKGHKRVCYHTYVQPYTYITDFNSPLTGLKPNHPKTLSLLSKSPCFDVVKATIQCIFRHRKIVVMDGQQDFTVFGLGMENFRVVDISDFIVDEDDRSVSIRRLMAGLYNIDFSSEDSHDPSDDAYWTLKLFYDFLWIQGPPKNGMYDKVVVDVPKGGRIKRKEWYRKKKKELALEDETTA